MKWAVQVARRFGLARSLCLVLLALMVVLRIVDPSPIAELRLRAFDFFQELKPRVATQRPVVIVDIDEKSLKALGQWPWPRTRIADLITQLTKMRALVIGFDVVFPEPDRMSPQIAAQSFQGLDEATKEKLQALPDSDQVMADAIRKSRVVLGETGLPTVQAASPGGGQSAGVAMMGGDATPFLYNFPGHLRNIPILEKAAAGHGLFTIRVERDGIVRRVPMVLIAQGAVLPSLTFEMLRVAAGKSTILIRRDAAGVESVAIPGVFNVPTDRNGQVWVHFAPHDPARFVPAVDVLQSKVPADRFAQRLVIVGTSAAGLLDIKTTPVDAAMPGVEINAQVLESVLSGSTLSSPNYAIVLELAAGILASVIFIWLTPILGPLPLLVLGGAIVALLVGTSWYLFVEHRMLLDFTFPVWSSSIIYLTLIFTNFVSEQAKRRQIRSAFGQYLSPALVEQLAQQPEKLVLGGEQRDMTVMFSDVRGFTTISEIYKSDPQALTSLMNSFLTPLTNAIIDRKGTIDKYMGDAIMAFWNAPLYDPDHEVNACEAAIDMLERLERLNQAREQEAKGNGKSFIPIHVGIGINTGSCVVGNMGSDLRFDYSVLGDSVNLASRLEGQCKNYGLPIIIGSKTAQATKERFAILEIDFIAVKGKKEPEVVYAIMGRDDLAKSGRFQRWRDLNIKMLSCYRSRDWAGALAVIDEGRAADEESRFATLYNVYAARIRSFQVTPPPDDWQGAYALETK